jgi:mono/diheme cytochrome c family protein
MAKAKTKRVQPLPPPPPVADEPPAEPDEKLSRGGIIGLAAVVAGCAAATALLLSGWTPGPSQPSPQSVAASAPPATTPAPAKPVKQNPPKPRARPKPKPPTPTQVSADLFAGECGICHTLSAVGTTGRVGPNLDDMKPTEARVLAAIRNGGRGTGLMSPGMLTGSDAVRVAKFVAEASRR